MFEKLNCDPLPCQELGIEIIPVDDFVHSACMEQAFAQVVAPTFMALFRNNPCCGQGSVEVWACGDLTAALAYVERCAGRKTGFGFRAENEADVNWLGVERPAEGE